MRPLKKHEFAFLAHWEEHKKYLKLEGCRITDARVEFETVVEVVYSIPKVARWIVRYGFNGPGDIDLYILQPSLDNLKTLKEYINNELEGCKTSPAS